MISNQLLAHFYSDAKYDGTAQFYNWIRQFTGSGTILLNLGAGPATESPVRSFKHEVTRVIGADVHPSILGNAELDEALLIRDDRIPLPDASIDIALSDYVLEQVERSVPFLQEVRGGPGSRNNL